MPRQWVLYKKHQDSNHTGQSLGMQLVAGLSGLAFEWWRWLPQEARNEMLSADDADQQILQGLSKEFYGSDDKEEYDHLDSLFLSARLCDLSKSEDYFCYMQNLLVSSGKSGEPAYLKHYLRSFPKHVSDVVEQFLKDKHIDLRGMSLAQLHAYILETW